jgi:hypothetical protein
LQDQFHSPELRLDLPDSCIPVAGNNSDGRPKSRPDGHGMGGKLVLSLLPGNTGHDTADVDKGAGVPLLYLLRVI